MVVHDPRCWVDWPGSIEALWRIAVPITGGTELNGVKADAQPGIEAAADLSECGADGRVDCPRVRGQRAYDRAPDRPLAGGAGSPDAVQLGVQASRQGWLRSLRWSVMEMSRGGVRGARRGRAGHDPAGAAAAMDNVVVLVEARTAEEPELLGLYEGVALTERTSDYGGVLPDRITIYQDAIVDVCADRDEVVHEVAVTVVHEIAHHFGIDEDTLHELGLGLERATTGQRRRAASTASAPTRAEPSGSSSRRPRSAPRSGSGPRRSSARACTAR